MARYITKKCPYCGNIYRYHDGGPRRQYGSTLQTCVKCNQRFWDTDIKEPALYGYNNAYEHGLSFVFVLKSIIFSAFGLLFLVGGIVLLLEKDMASLACIAVAALFLISPAIQIKNFIYKKIHRKEIIAQRQAEYDASWARLKDTAYLAALAERDHIAKQLLQARNSGKAEQYAPRPTLD